MFTFRSSRTVKSKRNNDGQPYLRIRNILTRYIGTRNNSSFGSSPVENHNSTIRQPPRSITSCCPFPSLVTLFLEQANKGRDSSPVGRELGPPSLSRFFRNSSFHQIRSTRVCNFALNNDHTLLTYRRTSSNLVRGDRSIFRPVVGAGT